MKGSSRENCNVVRLDQVAGVQALASMKGSSRKNCKRAGRPRHTPHSTRLNEGQFPKELQVGQLPGALVIDVEASMKGSSRKNCKLQISELVTDLWVPQ